MSEAAATYSQRVIEQREYVRSQATRLGLTITELPGGFRLLGRFVDLWVSDLYHVTDQDLSLR